MAEDTKAAPEAKPASGGGSKIVPILLVVNLLLVVGVLALFFLKGSGGSHAAEAKPATEGEKGGGEHGDAAGEAGAPGPTTKLADFVVHLRDADSERYARVSFEMEVQDEKAKEAVTVRMPQIRDVFLAYLSDRTAEELRGSDAIARVKGTLSQKLSEIAPGSPVRNLFVTELIVQ